MEFIRHGHRHIFGDDLSTVDGAFVRQRPRHDGALDASDLVPGLWITVFGAVGTPGEGYEIHYLVLNGPHQHPSLGQAVDLVEGATAHGIGLDNMAQLQTRDRMSSDAPGVLTRGLVDIGAAAGGDGMWNPCYYTVRSAEQPETDLSYARFALQSTPEVEKTPAAKECCGGSLCPDD